MKKIFSVLSVFAVMMFLSCKHNSTDNVDMNDSISFDSIEVVDSLLVDSLVSDSVD